MTSFSDAVRKHSEDPHGVGTLPKDDDDVVTALVGSPASGNVMRFQLRIGEGGVIADARCRMFGCASSIACCSFATHWVKGKTVDEAEELGAAELIDALELVPVQHHCAIHVEDALREAIYRYRFPRGLASIAAVTDRAETLVEGQLEPGDVDLAEAKAAIDAEMQLFRRLGYEVDWTAIARAHRDRLASSVERHVEQAIRDAETMATDEQSEADMDAGIDPALPHETKAKIDADARREVADLLGGYDAFWSELGISTSPTG